ncbi:MAG: ATP-binding protein [Pseudomonadota bacterium]
MENTFREETSPFKPKARIMELLGEQLIRSHVLALFELVKNSYDADASSVTISMVDVENSAEGLIEVQDNGSGMSFDTVTNIWMEPGHSHRGDQKKIGRRTSRGRLPIGEKGVGRFAVHRLGKNITLVTKSHDFSEVVVDINWEDFVKHDLLSTAEIAIRERESEVFKDGKTGTRITIGNLKQSWKRGEVRKLYKQILGMTVASVTEKKVSDFEVKFEIKPNSNWLKDLLIAEQVQEHALFRFDFSLTDEGLNYDYYFTPLPAMQADYKDILRPKIEHQNITFLDFFVLNPPDGKPWSKRTKRSERPQLSGEKGLKIGPLSGSILGFDFDSEIKKRYLKDEAGGISEFLKEQGGIRVYRDGLRVYDYGEQGNDWLGLDHRRIQTPAAKLSNQIILGELHLDLSQSEELKEKTSREGFIENKAYEELQYAMICILSMFEIERNKDKKILRLALETKPNQKNPAALKKKDVESLLEELNFIAIDRKQGDIIDIVQRVGKSYREAREALLSSSGAGLGLITVFHELERGVRGLHHLIQSNASIEVLQSHSSEIVSMFQGVMYLVNKKSMETLNASKLVELAIATQNLRFKRHDVTFINGFHLSKEKDFEVRVLRRMLIASIVNLIDNAIYWTDRNDGKSIIWIGPSHDLEHPAIIIADNGPGFMDAPEDLIEPFFSRKTEGMGIGLYYTDWVMRSHRGRLAFPDRNDLNIPEAVNGAVVALVFGEGDM